MKVLLCGNCQVDGLHVFLSRALPRFEFRRLPHLATFYGEFSEEQIAEDHAWADLVFFHHKHDHPQDYPTKQPKIPLSVWFQSAPFIAQSEDCDWLPVIEHAALYGMQSACDYAAREADFNYHQKWKNCCLRMQEKEVDEEVPNDLRISDLNWDGREMQYQLTCNHPTSIIFLRWAERIIDYLDLKSSSLPSVEECIQNPNIAGLPCEESATSGARRHLGLKWGGRPEDDDSGRLIARERITRLMS